MSIETSSPTPSPAYRVSEFYAAPPKICSHALILYMVLFSLCSILFIVFVKHYLGDISSFCASALKTGGRYLYCVTVHNDGMVGNGFYLLYFAIKTQTTCEISEIYF